MLNTETFTVKDCFYLLVGIFISAADTNHIDYDLASYFLIKFSNLILNLDSQTISEIHPSLADSRLIQKLKNASTNNPDRFDLTWFHYYFKHQISVL